MEEESISIDDIIKIILYWQMAILRFSTKYNSEHGWKLSNNNTMVERIGVGGGVYEVGKFGYWRIQIHGRMVYIVGEYK